MRARTAFAWIGLHRPRGYGMVDFAAEPQLSAASSPC